MSLLQKTIFLSFLISLIITNSSCRKVYSNKECMHILKERASDYSSLSRQDKALFEIGASIACRGNDNDPNKTEKAIRKME